MLYLFLRIRQWQIDQVEQDFHAAENEMKAVAEAKVRFANRPARILLGHWKGSTEDR